MKLKDLKCKNCGAAVKVEENATQAKCDFCHTTFEVENAYNNGYKFEKGRMQAQDEQIEKNIERAKGILGPIGKIFAAHYVISAVIAIIVFAIIIITFIFSMISQSKTMSDPVIDHNDVDIVEDIHEEIQEEIMDEFEINRFNNNFEIYVGTKYGTSVWSLIDEISTNNKKDKELQVTLKYRETETKDPEVMKNLKDQFDKWTQYEVSFEYDEKGLIYLALIED